MRDDVLLFKSSCPMQYLFKEAGAKQSLKELAGIPRTLDLPFVGSRATVNVLHKYLGPSAHHEGAVLDSWERVDLSRLRANLLTVIAEGDHITPPCQSESILDKISSTDKEIFRVKGGHIGIMAGNGAHKHTWPHIESWLGARSN
jgi:hypothetical protein